MNNKEVGVALQKRLAELELMYPDRKGVEAFEMDIVVGLIQKLAEVDIAHLKRLKYHGYYPDDFNPLKHVLAKYGIAEHTWNK